MKKILLSVSIMALLAAGCGSAPQSSSSTGSSNSPEAMAPSPAPSPTGSAMNTMDNSAWQATLMSSNNSAKGKYMISVSGHTIYLNTGRDYSQLLGKTVNVSYSGTMDSFTLGNITAK